jgi:hypothetical protein
MSENLFWLRICTIVATVTVILIAAVTFSGYDKRDKWEKAVANGADPMVTACAIFNQERSEEAACLLMSQNRK